MTSTVVDNSTLHPATYTSWNGPADASEEHGLYHVTKDYSGKASVVVPLTISATHTLKTLAYPTPWLDYPAQYHWQGVLPTHDDENSPTCTTATEELIIGELYSHPEYPQPTEVVSPAEDVSGKNHVPLWVPLRETSDKSWFDAAFTSESAFAHCSSVAGKPAPTGEYYAAKYVFETQITTVTTISTADSGHVESSTTGFEEPERITRTRSVSSRTPHDERTEDWYEETETGTPPIYTQVTAHVEASTSAFEDMSRVTLGGSRPTRTGGQFVTGGGPPSDVPEKGDHNRLPDSSKPIAVPAAVPAKPTPVFTVVPTIVNNRPTWTPAYIMPDTSATATLGQLVALNGIPIVLAAPAAAYLWVPTTINGHSTSTPIFLISGTSTATIGQTIALSGPQGPRTTVLAAPHAPSAVYTLIPTYVNGAWTSLPGYIISGSLTATLGQTVTIDGTPTVLTAPAPARTLIPTTINGTPTLVPAYIISGTTTAFPGQTVTLDGKLTTLATPRVYKLRTTTVDGREAVVTEDVGGGVTSSVGARDAAVTEAFGALGGTERVDSRLGGMATTVVGGPVATSKVGGVGRVRGWDGGLWVLVGVWGVTVGLSL